MVSSFEMAALIAAMSNNPSGVKSTCWYATPQSRRVPLDPSSLCRSPITSSSVSSVAQRQNDGSGIGNQGFESRHNAGK